MTELVHILDLHMTLYQCILPLPINTVSIILMINDDDNSDDDDDDDSDDDCD
jgi:hypothetical protein